MTLENHQTEATNEDQCRKNKENAVRKEFQFVQFSMTVQGDFLTGGKQLAQLTGISLAETARKRSSRLIRFFHA
jgi:hypothetical protein